MTSWLLFYECELCGIIYKIHIGKYGIAITMLDNLYSYERLFNLDGYLICIECKHENKLKIQKVY